MLRKRKENGKKSREWSHLHLSRLHGGRALVVVLHFLGMRRVVLVETLLDHRHRLHDHLDRVDGLIWFSLWPRDVDRRGWVDKSAVKSLVSILGCINNPAMVLAVQLLWFPPERREKHADHLKNRTTGNATGMILI